MAKITNEVLNEKLDNISSQITEIKCETKANTEFRLQFKGFITALVFIASSLGAGIVSILNYLMGKG